MSALKQVLHTIDSLRSDRGGPSRTVPALARQLLAGGRWQPTLLVADQGPAADPGWPADDMLRAHLRPCGATGFVREMRRRVPAGPGRGTTLVHDHGCWLLSNALSGRGAKAAGLPLVISARGMLEPWALQHRGWKKRLALALYQRRLLEHATVFHATSADEAHNLRHLGLTQPVAVIPNGVDVPAEVARSPKPGGGHALFLSRLSVKKGVVPLLQAWARIKPAGWTLSIVGPDEGGYRADVERTIQALSLQTVVDICGEANDAEKWQHMAHADLFILPSFSENFGVVVAEALASGIPVITTTGTPWRDLVGRGCGWWVAPDTDGLAIALAQATATPAANLHAMGAIGRAWMKADFSWDAIGRSMADLYDWVAMGQPAAARPEFVLPGQR